MNLKLRKRREVEKKRRAYDPDDLRWVAAHEAAHAVAAFVFGIPIVCVHVRKTRLPTGETSSGAMGSPFLSDPDFLALDEVRRMQQLVLLMAGPVAEGVMNRRVSVVLAAQRVDAEEVKRLATVWVCGPLLFDREANIPEFIEANEPRIVNLCDRAVSEATQFVVEHVHAIQAVAKALLKRGYMKGNEVREIVERVEAKLSA